MDAATPTVADIAGDSARVEMTTVLGDVVKQHHSYLLDAQRHRAQLRDRRASLEAELRQVETRTAEADRDVQEARELLAMSWEHYRSHVERRV
jgi:hypothetical protein